MSSSPVGKQDPGGKLRARTLSLIPESKQQSPRSRALAFFFPCSYLLQVATVRHGIALSVATGVERAPPSQNALLCQT